MKRIPPSLGKFLLALGATLATLLVCELGVRLIGVSPTVIPIGLTKADDVCQRSDNPILSYELKPNYRNSEADGRDSFAYTNAHGQRDVERQWDKPPQTKRIVLLGDSVVVGYGVQDLDALMSRQLEKLLEPEEVEVINLGVSGYCTRAEVELLKEKGLRYDPDLVVLVFVENDFVNFQRESRYIEGRYDRPALVKGLFRYSDLFRLACLKLNLFGYGLEADPARWNQLALGDNNVDDGLRLLRELAEQHGFEVVVAIWPHFTNTDIDYNEMMYMPDGSGELVVEQLAKNHGLTTIRLDEEFDSDWQEDSSRIPRQYYTIGDFMHPSVEGHQTAARILRDQIVEHSWLESADPPRTLLAPQPADAEALAAARERGSEKSDYSALHLNQGRELIQQGKLEEAFTEFKEVIRLNPQKYAGAAHFEIAEALRKHSDSLDESALHYTEAIRWEPDDSAFHANYALLLRRMGRGDEAIGEFQRAIEIDPDVGHYHFNLGVALKDANRLEEAAQQYATAVELSPNDSDFRNNYGNLLRMLKQFSDAIGQLEEAVRLDPNSAHAQFNLALAYAESEQIEKAKTSAERAKQLSLEQNDKVFSNQAQQLLEALENSD